MEIHYLKKRLATAIWPFMIFMTGKMSNHGSVHVGRCIFFFVVSACIALFSAHPLAAQDPVKLIVAPAGSATWADHLAFQQTNPNYGKEPKAFPFMPMPLGSTNRILEGQPGPSTPPEPALGDGEALIPTSTNFQALPDNGVIIPPDTMGAVGPNHLMVMLNSQVRIQSKTGTDLDTVTLATWWTSGTGLSGSPFDPRIIYDSLTDRWMAVVDAERSTTASRTWLAISQTNDPTGAWEYYAFNMESPNTNSLWHDFPDIGTNQHWIALTNNMFSSTPSFQGVGLVVIDKTTLGGVLTSYVFNQGFDDTPCSSWSATIDSFTMRPALTFDPAENSLYMVDGNRWGYYSDGSPATGLLRLSRITGVPPGGPSWSIVPDAAGDCPGTGLFSAPESYDPWYQIDASQSGTSTRVSTNDSRILNAVFRNGHLWFTHSGGGPNDGSRGANLDRTVVSWYEVDPTLLASSANPVLQSGTLDGGSDVHYFFPSIAVNQNDDAALGFSHSHSGIFVEAVLTGRQSRDTAGAMDGITTIKAGEDSYVKDFGRGTVRWGDYSATCVDPSDDTTFWTIQEYAATDVGPGSSDDRWSTWWSKAGYTSGATGTGITHILGPLLLD